MCGFTSSGFAGGAMGAATMMSASALLAVAGVVLWATLGQHSWRWLPTRVRPVPTVRDPHDPLAIVRERFARGEIDATTLEEHIAHLLRAERGADA